MFFTKKHEIKLDHMQLVLSQLLSIFARDSRSYNENLAAALEQHEKNQETFEAAHAKSKELNTRIEAILPKLEAFAAKI